MRLHVEIAHIAAKYEAGEWPRFWVNDSGPVLVGTIQYGGDTDDIEVNDFVGLVDEEAGGMIAYGKQETMEDLADQLNRLHVAERIIKSRQS